MSNSLVQKGNLYSSVQVCEDILKKLQFEDCKPVCTPMTVGCKLRKEYDSKSVDPKH